MKRIILGVVVMAFAVAVQAGEGKTCQDKDKAACCASKVKTSLEAGTSQDKDQAEPACCASKVKTSVVAKGDCPFAMSACSKQTAAKQTPAKQIVLLSPKAASLASN